MFKKLKEKITEEVKSSPQRFQQLTQSVSDRLQSASTSDENFFSIGDDDAPAMSTNYEPGFTSVALTSPTERKFRRNSNSSVASDVSFLPKYESLTNMYHLQSDLEISASEMEDNASSSSQLGHLSKEQIYSAFTKSQMRYHKYRGRYTDLAKHYKDLEKENSKIKSVLVETQDKAIRRVTELKEQCSLEQKAKAHLEGALRDEMDEKELKIQSLQTKIELLQSSGGLNQEGENLANLNKYLTDARQEIETLNQRIQEMKANGIIFQAKEHEYRTKISGLEKEIALFAEREKENNLSLAQNKMELHNELVNKDTEISGLKQDNEGLRKSLETMTSGNSKLENLQTQNKKLIDKVDTLTSKCNNYESELLKMEQYRVESQNLNSVNAELGNRMKDLQISLDTVREDAKKSLLSLENKVQEKLRKEYEEKEKEIVDQFKRKLDEISGGANDLKEMQLSLMKKEEEMKMLREEHDQTCRDLKTEIDKYSNLERDHLELIEDSVGLRGKIGVLEKESATLHGKSEACELKLGQLRTYVAGLERQIDEYKEVEREKDQLMLQLQVRREEDEDKSGQMEEETKKWTAKLEKLLQDLQTSENAVARLTGEKVNLSKELELVKKRNEELAEEIKKLEEANSSLRDVEVEKEKLVQEMRKIEEFSSSKVETLEEEIRNLVNCNQQLEEDNVQLKELQGRFEEKDANVGLQINRLNEELGAARASLQKKEEEICNVTQQVEQEKVRLLKEANCGLQSKEEELKKLEATVNRLNEELGAVRVSLQKKDEEIFSMTQEADVTREKEEERNGILEEVRLLKEANRGLQTKEEELKKLETTVNRLNEELGAVRVSLQKKDEEIFSMTQQAEVAREKEEERSRILEEVRLLKEANRGLQSKEEELKKLEATVNRLNEELGAVRVSLQKKNEEIFSMTQQAEVINEKEEERNRILEEVRLLKEANRGLESKEEELKKLGATVNRLNEELGAVRVSLQKKDEEIFNMTQEAEVIKEQEEEERNRILEEVRLLKEANRGLESKEEELKKLEATVNRLNEELGAIRVSLQKKDEEIFNMTQEADVTKEKEEERNRILEEVCLLKEANRGLQTKEEELKKLEATVNRLNEELGAVRVSLQKKDEEIFSMTQQAEVIKKTEEERNRILEEVRLLKEANRGLQSKEEELKKLGATVNRLNEELGAVRVSLQKKDEEIFNMTQEAEVIKEQEEEERNRILEEVRLLKEANRGLQSKEEELKKLEAYSSEEVTTLSSQLERRVQIEEELSRKNQEHEETVSLKNRQIEILSKRLEDCNDLIKERNKGIVTIFNSFLIENPISFVPNGEQKQLQSVEDKLQNFETIYAVEKENLGKVLKSLKRFEEDYLSISSERNQLKSDKEQLIGEVSTLRSHMGATEQMADELIQLREKNAALVEDERKTSQSVIELEARNAQVVLDSNFLSEENTGLLTEIEELKIKNEEIAAKYANAEGVIGELRTNSARLERDLAEADAKLKNLSALERRVSEVLQAKQLVEAELKAKTTDSGGPNDEVDRYANEIEMLKTKVVQYKSLDLTNRSSIEFYENELQKLKNQNEKLNRRLDETLVTLNHCSELSNSTEIEYLRNVLYNYMLGKESLVLARVIAAVCKFDPHQTETVLAKEQQKQTLLGQLGIL